MKSSFPGTFLRYVPHCAGSLRRGMLKAWPVRSTTSKALESWGQGSDWLYSAYSLCVKHSSCHSPEPAQPQELHFDTHTDCSPGKISWAQCCTLTDTSCPWVHRCDAPVSKSCRFGVHQLLTTLWDVTKIFPKSSNLGCEALWLKHHCIFSAFRSTNLYGFFFSFKPQCLLLPLQTQTVLVKLLTF